MGGPTWLQPVRPSPYINMYIYGRSSAGATSLGVFGVPGVRKTYNCDPTEVQRAYVDAGVNHWGVFTGSYVPGHKFSLISNLHFMYTNMYIYMYITRTFACTKTHKKREDFRPLLSRVILTQRGSKP